MVPWSGSLLRNKSLKTKSMEKVNQSWDLTETQF